jgi:class 3 adenylate cyclase/TolB-like protein/Flp pilus assembly protein TadD
VKRKLTTILCADVAGYSRLMSRDEEGTHVRLVALFRDLIEPAIRAHGGTLVKTTGDGFLAEFVSVVEALRCAIDIQRDVGARNADFSADQAIRFRVGINIGDIIVEAGGDIFGDGVNVAARLEGLAAPGAIVVSRAVRDHVHGKVDLAFEDMGHQPVKNIARPIHAFRVRTEPGAAKGRRWRGLGPLPRRFVAAIAVTAAAAILGGVGWLNQPASLPEAEASRAAPALSATPLSIAVLPFANLGNNPQQDYFVDGITDSLTTDLSRALPGSFVVARGTAFTYKGQPVDASRVGSDLNVRYLLEGSVIAGSDRVRVNARLIDAASNSELWAERFDSRRRDVLEIQDQIVGRLSRAIGLQLIDIEARRSVRERPGNPSAVDFVMRGQAIANRPASRESMIAARALFQQALDDDPDNVDALAGMATTYVYEVLNSYYDHGREKRLQDAAALVQRALALDPRHIVALKIHAAVFRAEGRFEDAIAASHVVIAQNPGEPWAYKEIGLSELYLGRFPQALDWFEKANQIGPHDPSRWIWLGAMGRVAFFLGRPEEAIRLLRQSADANPKDIRASALLAAIYAAMGRTEDAAAALADCNRLQPEVTINQLFADWSVPLQATSPAYLRQHERLRDGLRRAGMPEG